MKCIRTVPVIALTFILFLILTPTFLKAQGVGVNLGPFFITDYDVALSPGFTAGLDSYFSVSDATLWGTSLQFTSFPVDNENTGFSAFSGEEFSSLKTLSLLMTFRLRIAADLDEIAPIFTLGLGPAYRFGGTLDGDEDTTSNNPFPSGFGFDDEVNLVGNIPVSVEGWIGAGVDWPIMEDKLALIGQLRYPVQLLFVENYNDTDFDTEIATPGVALTVGFEYRSR